MAKYGKKVTGIDPIEDYIIVAKRRTLDFDFLSFLKKKQYKEVDMQSQKMTPGEYEKLYLPKLIKDYEQSTEWLK